MTAMSLFCGDLLKNILAYFLNLKKTGLDEKGASSPYFGFLSQDPMGDPKKLNMPKYSDDCDESILRGFNEKYFGVFFKFEKYFLREIKKMAEKCFFFNFK